MRYILAAVPAAALEFIAANSHRPIGINDVARAIVAEPKTLQRRFRKVLDCPIAKEICRVRIERAKRGLTHGDQSMSAIARGAGFGTRDRMYVVFQREEGISPSDYRKHRQVEGEV